MLLLGALLWRSPRDGSAAVEGVPKRTVIAAARRGGVRAVGVDIDPERIVDGRRNPSRARVDKRAEFAQADGREPMI